jgi:integrase/recombinase XerD
MKVAITPSWFRFSCGESRISPRSIFVERQPAHHNAALYLDAWIGAAGIKKGTALWRSITKDRNVGENRMIRIDVYRMIKKRCWHAELGAAANCHTFRATGITAYLLNGGSLENAQAIAAHESPRTTKLYDRTADEITLDEIERIGI